MRADIGCRLGTLSQAHVFAREGIETKTRDLRQKAQQISWLFYSDVLHWLEASDAVAGADDSPSKHCHRRIGQMRLPELATTKHHDS